MPKTLQVYVHCMVYRSFKAPDKAPKYQHIQFIKERFGHTMLTFEVVNELALRVTCRGNDVLIAKAGSFICGENNGYKNYKF